MVPWHLPGSRKFAMLSMLQLVCMIYMDCIESPTVSTVHVSADWSSGLSCCGSNRHVDSNSMIAPTTGRRWIDANLAGTCQALFNSAWPKVASAVQDQ